MPIRLSPSIESSPKLAPKSLWNDAWYRLKSNVLAMFGLAFFVFVTLLSYIAPPFYPYSPEEQNNELGATPPFAQAIELRYDQEQVEADETIKVKEFLEVYASAPDQELTKIQQGEHLDIDGLYFKLSDETHVLGTDTRGRDLFARILQGGQISLGVGFLATFVALVIGIAYGAIAGYVGGRTDAFMMRAVDILYALPFLIFVILLMVVFEGFKYDILLIFIAIGAVEWLTMARIVRGQVVHLRSQDFVLAAKSMGVGTFSILWRHIAPNILGPVIVYATLLIPAVMLLESTLSFLGLGIRPPNASWGTLIKEGAELMQVYPWLLIVPAAFFSLTLFSMNFLGDGLRDALDVKSSKD
mgnify:CR=1 FL=1